MKKYSRTFTDLLKMIIKFSQEAKDAPVYEGTVSGISMSRSPTGRTAPRLRDPIVIAHTHLWQHCSSAEWHLVGHITSELKEYNALWYCEPELKGSSSVKKAIRGLIGKKVIVATETTNIYLVNPAIIRRGSMDAVLMTTANLLSQEPVVSQEMIRDCKPINKLDYGFEVLQLVNG